ncbi:hypothetical protein C479_08358 [Halovivax asiaticus JCM 14624]|uniref:ABC-2 type transporter n=1 Tax=Halovivax asiaticus JCM 14624 TaxID=1227490 RepID=M0BMF1_9EURY|nr:hypothetical protein [Halovivax asiaticus]ELZ10809.1 hypothetical protein C479_08358 [Halovivax asiaticus JCM 14624]
MNPNASYVLLRAQVRKRIALLKRYPFNTVSQIATIYVFFLIIFFAGNAFSQFAITDHLEGIIVGYFYWTMAVGAYQSYTGSLIDEAQWGTLEQLFMSRYSFGAINATIIIVFILETFVWGGIILVLMVLTTGVTLHIDLLTIVPILVLSLSGPIAISLILGGLALLFKRVENIFTIVQFLFVGLIAAPVDSFPWLKWLPISLGSALLQRSMEGGERLYELPAADLALLVGQSIAFLAIGYAIFIALLNRARKKGVMGHY